MTFSKLTCLWILWIYGRNSFRNASQIHLATGVPTDTSLVLTLFLPHALVTSFQQEPLALRTAYSGVSCIPALEEAFHIKHCFHPAASLSRVGVAIPIEESQNILQGIPDTHCGPNALTSVSSNPESASRRTALQICLSLDIVHGRATTWTLLSVCPASIHSPRTRQLKYNFIFKTYHDYWSSVTSISVCASLTRILITLTDPQLQTAFQRGLVPGTQMSTSQTQSPRLTYTFISGDPRTPLYT